MDTILLAFISTVVLLLAYNFGRLKEIEKEFKRLEQAGTSIIKKLNKLDTNLEGKSEEELKTLLEESTRLGGMLEGVNNLMEGHLKPYRKTRTKEDK